MRHTTVLFALLAPVCVAVLNVPSGVAQEVKAGQLTIEHPWARPTLGKAPNSAAYMKITNHGGTPDKLVGVKSDVANDAQMHMVEKQREVMRMRQVKGGITVPAKASVELKPGGYHIMLLDLRRKLSKGDMFDMTLQFEHQGEVPVQVKIEKMGGMGAGTMKHDAMNKGAMKDAEGHSDHNQGGHKH